ncbi:NADPH-dependent FMN reductase-like domain-containing protein [Entamoeba marina]
MSTSNTIKVLMVNGSARPHGNTSVMLNWVKEGLEKEGIECEIYQIGGKTFKACTACNQCLKTGKCVLEDPVIDELNEKMLEADGIILGSPTYYADVTMEMKGMMDRCGRANHGGKLKRKVGAAVVMARRGGAIHTFDTLNHWFTIQQMYIVGSSYWNDGYNPNQNIQDQVKEDEEAQRTMTNLADNMAHILKLMKK